MPRLFRRIEDRYERWRFETKVLVPRGARGELTGQRAFGRDDVRPQYDEHITQWIEEAAR